MRARAPAPGGARRAPRLAPVPVVDGSVKLMLFGRTSGDTPGAGRSRLRARDPSPAKPALYGDNRAAFSVELDDRGITILDQAMRGEMAPIGVVYGLDYLALRPAYHVKLKIDWDRVQDIMDTTYGHEGLFTVDPDPGHGREARRGARHQVRGRHLRARGRGRDDHRAARRGRRARARHDHGRVLRELDRSAPRGAGRLGQGGRASSSRSPRSASRRSASSPTRRRTTRGSIKKRLDVDFSERTTIKRSIYPQGHLSGLFRAFGEGLDPDPAGHQRQCRRPVVQAAQGARDLARPTSTSDPVRSITATLTYGDVTKTVLLDKSKPEEAVEWPSTVADGRMIEPVAMRFEVELKPIEARRAPEQAGLGRPRCWARPRRSSRGTCSRWRRFRS